MCKPEANKAGRHWNLVEQQKIATGSNEETIATIELGPVRLRGPDFQSFHHAFHSRCGPFAAARCENAGVIQARCHCVH